MTNTHIISNQVKCKQCGDVIFSAHRHDFVSCSCGHVSVDGGNDYLRRVGGPNYIEQSLSMPEEDFKQILASVHWATSTGRNNLGIAYAVMRAIRDTNYKLIKGD